LDTYNVGSIFRLADAVAAEKVFLCGETLTPPNTRIKKASINTTEWVEWEYCKTAGEAIEKLKTCHSERSEESSEVHKEDPSLPTADQDDTIKVIAVELDERSVPYDKVEYKFPLAIVVGNETYGVSKEVLEMADEIVELPMFGVNKSLNVMVSVGIILYKLTEKL
ncbi:hypothetical protein COU94_00640, partial [Candidatus Shapirobacteria bacterium CG10_big_fil_rev_8_21_14_0_10_38_8]